MSIINKLLREKGNTKSGYKIDNSKYDFARRVKLNKMLKKMKEIAIKEQTQGGESAGKIKLNGFTDKLTHMSLDRFSNNMRHKKKADPDQDIFSTK